MTRKDIALTVTGVLASMALAYLFYRMQQRDAAQSAAANADNVANQQASEMAMIASLPSYNAGGSATAPTVSASPVIDTSGEVASTDPSNLISQTLAAFAGSMGGGASYSPTIIQTVPTSTEGNIVATTASAVMTQANNDLGISTQPVATQATPAPTPVGFIPNPIGYSGGTDARSNKLAQLVSVN